MPDPIGIIAGFGDLPLITARSLRHAGHSPVAVGLAGQFDPALPALCDQFSEVGIFQAGVWARKLRKMGVTQAIMVGGVHKNKLMYQPFWKKFQGSRPDWTTLMLWYRTLRHDRRSQTLLTALANSLQTGGIELIDTTQYIPDHLATAGVLTRKAPTATQQADIDFGWPILMRMNDLEIGQSLGVRDRDVIAVEAIEGTDAMIERAGTLARGPWTLLKGAGPDKDLRFDVPTIGIATIEKLKAANAACLAIQAGQVILVEREQVLAAADTAGIAIVGVT